MKTSQLQTQKRSKSDKRLNRVQLEWKQVLTSDEYCILDKLLFQSNLTDANEGKGFFFHVRTLSKELNISLGKVSQTLKQWPFIKKQGTTKGMTIQFLYDEFIKWIVHEKGMIVHGSPVIVHVVNNDCSPGEPRSNKEEVFLESKLEKGFSVVIQPANAGLPVGDRPATAGKVVLSGNYQPDASQSPVGETIQPVADVAAGSLSIRLRAVTPPREPTLEEQQLAWEKQHKKPKTHEEELETLNRQSGQCWR
jgi:hypothetical protein